MVFLQLFWTFLKIGLFTFGGGYAMIALIQSEVTVTHHWLTPQEFTDILAVSQMTPGPVGINTATYTGYTAVLNAGYEPWQAKVVVGLIAAAALQLLTVDSFGMPSLSLQFILSIAVFLAVFILSLRRTSPILLILASGVVGIIVYSLFPL